MERGLGLFAEEIGVAAMLTRNFENRGDFALAAKYAQKIIDLRRFEMRIIEDGELVTL